MMGNALPVWGIMLAAAYLAGSIPTGYLVSRWIGGGDIREHGSGNIGATNAYRVYGKLVGILTLAGDVLKGSAVVLIALLPGIAYLPEVSALVVVIGHTFSCFLGFRGGKGVATALGVFAILAPWSSLFVLVVWILVLSITRRVSVGSLAASLAMPPLVLLCGYPVSTFFLSVGIALLIVLTHRENIQRLREGREPTINTQTPL